MALDSAPFLSGVKMTVEELRERLEDAYMAGETLASLRSEILDLVEAASADYGHPEPWATMKALEAFNKALEEL